MKRGITLVGLPTFIVKNHIFAYVTLKLTPWPWKWPSNIKIVAENRLFSPTYIKKTYYTSPLFSFVKNYIFTFLTLEYTFWWPWIEFDLEDDFESPKYNYKWIFSFKIPWKRGIKHDPSFICWKWYFILLDPEIDLLTSRMTLKK